MDLERFVTQAQLTPAEDLLADPDFARAVRNRATLAPLTATRALDWAGAPPERETWAQEHRVQWSRFVRNLGRWEKLEAELALPRTERVLVAGWHFPEIPALFAWARKIHALMLVSQDAPWLKALREAGCTLNISDPAAARALVREMQAGRIPGAMLDHAHPNTRCTRARLLGREVEIPSGVFALASRYDYCIAFVAPRPKGIEVVAQLDARGKSESELAQQYATALEQEVRRSPAAWLMWQAFPGNPGNARGAEE